jgi:hypothetical protein
VVASADQEACPDTLGVDTLAAAVALALQKDQLGAAGKELDLT